MNNGSKKEAVLHIVVILLIFALFIFALKTQFTKSFNQFSRNRSRQKAKNECIDYLYEHEPWDDLELINKYLQEAMKNLPDEEISQIEDAYSNLYQYCDRAEVLANCFE